MKKMFRVEERPLFPHHSVPPPPKPSTHLKPDYTKKKVQCNYNNIIAFHQSTVTCTGTSSCIGWGRCRPDTLPTAAWGTQGWGMQNCSTFLLPIFQESYTYCAHASCRICGPRGRFSLCWRDRGRIQKNESRGQHIMFSKYLCGKGKHLIISHKFMSRYSWRAATKITTRKLIYEGWNFNSGNYLFTTDTR